MADLHEWEVLHHNSDTDSVEYNTSTKDVQEGIEAESEGIIKTDYFSLDAHNKYISSKRDDDVTDSVDSDNPSWIDPDSVTRSPNRELVGGFWSDSGSSDGSDERKSVEFLVVTDPEGIDDSSDVVGGEVENGDGVMDGGGDKVVVVEAVKSDDGGGDGAKGVTVWWKLPLEVLKYCVLRINPVWTVSLAAAVMSFIVLGRRYHRMKKKSTGMQLDVTMDDKVSFWFHFAMSCVYSSCLIYVVTF